jgi:hypothetical protein
MINNLFEYRLDRTAFSIGRLEDEPDERAFWFSKTAEERLHAAEFLRQSIYGYDPATFRLQRIFEVVKLKPR